MVCGTFVLFFYDIYWRRMVNPIFVFFDFYFSQSGAIHPLPVEDRGLLAKIWIKMQEKDPASVNFLRQGPVCHSILVDGCLSFDLSRWILSSPSSLLYSYYYLLR